MEVIRVSNYTNYLIDVSVHPKQPKEKVESPQTLLTIKPSTAKNIFSGILTYGYPEYHTLCFDFRGKEKFIRVTKHDVEGCECIRFVEVNGKIQMKRVRFVTIAEEDEHHEDDIEDCNEENSVQKDQERKRSIQEHAERDKSIQEDEKRERSVQHQEHKENERRTDKYIRADEKKSNQEDEKLATKNKIGIGQKLKEFALKLKKAFKAKGSKN